MPEFVLPTHFQTPFESNQPLLQIFEQCSKSLKLLIELCDECTKVHDKKRLINLVPLALGAGSSAEAILRLLADGYTNEAVMLSRAYLERIVNFSYLLIADEEEFDNFVAFGRQKAFRKLDRSVIQDEVHVRQVFLGISPQLQKPKLL